MSNRRKPKKANCTVCAMCGVCRPLVAGIVVDINGSKVTPLPVCTSCALRSNDEIVNGIPDVDGGVWR